MTRTLQIVIGALGVILLVVLILWLQSCQRERSLEAQGKVDRGQQGALQNSAADAVNTIGGVATNEAAGVELGRRNEEEIRGAKGADTRVDPDANAAGLRAICRRASHRNDPACRLLQSDSR